jgi:hypothetical protein
MGMTLRFRPAFSKFLAVRSFSFFRAMEFFKYCDILIPVYLVTHVAIEGNVRWTMLIPASVTIFGLLPHEVRITNPIISIPKFNFLISVFILVLL